MSTASPKISVFLPSHNKGGFCVEAVRSVLAQNYDDYEFWLLENSTDDGKTRNLLHKFTDLTDPRVKYIELEIPLTVRQGYMVCPWLLNQYYPQANGEIILYISDDDLFMPGIFEAVATYFDEHPEHDALYFHLARTVARVPGEGKRWGERFTGIASDAVRGVGQMDCIIDSGQIAYRKSVLSLIDPLFYSGKDRSQACHADGLHMAALTNAGVLFYPLSYPGVIHRHTPDSTWSKDN